MAFRVIASIFLWFKTHNALLRVLCMFPCVASCLLPLVRSRRPTHANVSVLFRTDMCPQTGSFPKAAAGSRKSCFQRGPGHHPSNNSRIVLHVCKQTRPTERCRCFMCNVTCDSINDSGPCFYGRNVQIYDCVLRSLLSSGTGSAQEKQESRNPLL